MDEVLSKFFSEHRDGLPPGWSFEQQASELAQYALEGCESISLPELDIGAGGGVSQQEFDRAVEEAFAYLKGEALAWLQAQ